MDYPVRSSQAITTSLWAGAPFVFLSCVILTSSPFSSKLTATPFSASSERLYSTLEGALNLVVDASIQDAFSGEGDSETSFSFALDGSKER